MNDPTFVRADYAIHAQLTAATRAAGCDLMNSDAAYVNLCCQQVPLDARGLVVQNYVAAWVDAMQRETKPMFKQERGRFNANQWLMQLLQKKGLPIPQREQVRKLRLR